MSSPAKSLPAAVGFVGLGAMGAPMARNLRKNLPLSTVLCVYDIQPQAMLSFRDIPGVVCCSSSRELCHKSECIITIVQEGKHVRALYLEGLLYDYAKRLANSDQQEPLPLDLAAPAGGGGGSLVSPSEDKTDDHSGTGTGLFSVKDKIFIDCSTIDIETSSQMSTFVRSLGAHYYDAPVSGGTMGAENGTLTFMLGVPSDSNPSSTANPNPASPVHLTSDTTTELGGQYPHHHHPHVHEQHHARVRDICKMMGTNVFSCGGPTLGLASKLTNNYISGLITIATSEGMNLGMRLGLDPILMQRVFSTSTSQSWCMDKCNPVPGVIAGSPSSQGYKPGFKVQLMRKDFALAVESARRVDAKLVLGEKGLETYTSAMGDPRCVDLDARVVYRWLGGREPGGGGGDEGRSGGGKEVVRKGQEGDGVGGRQGV